MREFSIELMSLQSNADQSAGSISGSVALSVMELLLPSWRLRRKNSLNIAPHVSAITPGVTRHR